MTDIIKTISSEITATFDCEVMKAVQRVEISVDRESLIKALQLAEKIVYCKDCKWRNRFGCALEIRDDSDRPNDDDYCSFGERKEADE